MCFVHLPIVVSVMLTKTNFLSNDHPITNHQSVSNWCVRHQTHMYTFTYRHVPTNTCHTPTRRGPDYRVRFQLFLQDHPFILETTAGEDVKDPVNVEAPYTSRCTYLTLYAKLRVRSQCVMCMHSSLSSSIILVSDVFLVLSCCGHRGGSRGTLQRRLLHHVVFERRGCRLGVRSTLLLFLTYLQDHPYCRYHGW